MRSTAHAPILIPSQILVLVDYGERCIDFDAENQILNSDALIRLMGLSGHTCKVWTEEACF